MYYRRFDEAPSLPKGAQLLGGVPFVLGGKVEVTGLDAATAQAALEQSGWVVKAALKKLPRLKARSFR